MTIRRALRASIAVLLLAPFVLVLLVTGLVFLWENTWLLKWLWIPVPICWTVAYLLFRFGKQRYGSLWQPRSDILLHWTDQDRAAWQKVVAYADQLSTATTDQFFNADLYLETAQELSHQLAVHYHPEAKDAFESLTIPEILTATELAVSDIRRFVEQQIPGSHLLTVRWLKRAPQITTAWSQAKPLYYAATVFWHPWTVLSRAAAEGTVVNPVIDELKKEGLAGIFRAFVLQLGKYLIELNSHRLKVGPERWRALMDAESDAPAPVATAAEPASAAERHAPATLQIALVGQVKSGKSSLVNALIGRQQAAVDILPLTDCINQYTLHPGGTNAQLTLLDTVGYAHEGLKADRVEETMRVVCDSAMSILVMNACEPAREPDCAFLRTMETWFAEHPERRPPPVLAVLTHIDRLSPSLEWSPPYDGWMRPKPRRAKEKTIREAVLVTQELLGSRIAGIVPACTRADETPPYGIDQWVVPALIHLLPQAKAKHLVDVLYDERDRHRLAKLMSQLWNAASMLVKYQFCGIDALLPQPEASREEKAPPNP